MNIITNISLKDYHNCEKCNFIIENRLNHILVTMTTMFKVQIRNITIYTLDY